MYKHVQSMLGSCLWSMICSCLVFKVWQRIATTHQPLKWRGLGTGMCFWFEFM